jgi:hypothetical protein
MGDAGEGRSLLTYVVGDRTDQESNLTARETCLNKLCKICVRGIGYKVLGRVVVGRFAVGLTVGSGRASVRSPIP